MDNIFDLPRITAVFGATALYLMVSNHAQAQTYPYPVMRPANQYVTNYAQPAPMNGRYGAPTSPENNGLRTAPTVNGPSQGVSHGRYGAAPAGSNVLREALKVPEAYEQSFWEKLTGQNKQYYSNRSNQWRGARLQQYQTRPMLPPNPLDQFQTWSNTEPEYTLYPGDQIDIVVGSAPELSRTLTVGPDGRVVMPMTEPVMAAGRTMSAVQTDLSAQLATQLRDPRIDVTPRAYGSQQIFIGGEVAAQGTYALPGPIGAMEAILMAGGFQTSARTRQVVVLRRAANGGFMARTINFQDGLHNIRSFADNVQMKRGDIIFVPRTDISEVGLFMQSIRGALPFDLSLSYNLGDGFTNN